MKTVEFTTELNDSASLTIPLEAASQLPKSGKVRVILISGDDGEIEEKEWQRAGLEMFLRDDSPDDSIYDNHG